MTAEKVKTWLQHYGDLQREIENEIQLYETIEARTSGPRSSHLDGLPHGNGFSGDSLGGAVGYLDDIRRRIAKLQNDATEARHKIESYVQQIHGRGGADMRGCVRFRYLLCLPWADVNNALWGAKVDYLDKEDSYLRRTMKIHGDALQFLADIVPDDSIQMS